MMATAQAETPNHLYQQPQSDMNSQQQQPPQQSPAGYQQQPPNYSQPPMRFPGKPVPNNGGPPPSGVNQTGAPPPGQYPSQPMSGPPPPGQHNMRPGGSYHGGPQNSMGPHHGGPPQQPPSGPTPTLNQLLQSSGGGTNVGNGQASGNNSASGGANSGGAGHPRYPPTTGYEHTNSYPGGNPHPLKTDTQQYPPPPSGWPPAQQADRQGPPPSHVNNYHPPPQHMVDQQAMYRQGTPAGGPNRGGQGQPPPASHQQQYYNPPPGIHHGGQYPPQSSHYPPPPPGPGPPTQQQGRYPPPPGRDSAQSQPPPSHYPGQPQSPHYPPPPSQSPHYPPGPPHPAAQRYPPPGTGSPYPPPQQSQHYPPPHRYTGPPGMRPENQTPSHYHPAPSPGMTDSSGHAPPGRPPSASGNSLDGHPSRSTPPPPPSPSLQPPNQMNHHPPSPSQSPRSTPQLPPPPTSGPSHSPSHRSTNYPPPDVGDVTGCNSNDSATGPIGAGIRPSPSPTGSASSRSMSPAVGNQNIPLPPRPWSGQTESGPPRIPSDHYRSKVKKADSLNKLYEMDDNPERRIFLDKLLHFMEDLSTPITACPQISKNPLDLYKLYFLVKERGGFLEVTRNKTWKDIAGSLGIGASSSAAYTLRKHYTKHLLPFECKFDRGGIDPQPLINQVEQQTKKKGAKAAPVPSPGSSNSQDSFPGPNSGNNTGSMDSFPGYPSPYGGGGPPDYASNTPPGASPPQQRPPPTQGPPPGQQTQNQLPHPGEDKNNVSVSNPFDDMPSAPLPTTQPPFSFHQSTPAASPGYQGPPGSYSPYPPPPTGDHYGRGPGPPPGHDQYASQQQYPGAYPPPPGRQIYPGYPSGPPEATAQPPGGVQQQPPPSGPPGSDDAHQRYAMGPPPPAPGPPTGGYPSRTQNYLPNAAPPMNGYSDYYQHTSDQLFGECQSAEEPSELSALKSTLQKNFLNSAGRVELLDLLLCSNNPQGYPPLPGSPPQAPSPGGGKHMPPPHSSHMRGMTYPPQAGNQKDPTHAQQGQQPYASGYPPQPQPQQQQTQQRIPPYDQSQGGRQGNYMYPPPPGGSGREPQQNRSSPSPSANNIPPPIPHSQTAKQWIPPEGQGWPPNSSGQYTVRPYPPTGGSGPPQQPPHSHPASPGTTPIPPSQSPSTPGGPQPTQSPSPQPWASSGQPPGPVPLRNSGPMGTPPTVSWGTHSGGTVMSPQPPQTPPGQPPPPSQWPQHQSQHPRHPVRPPFPPSGGKGSEMYKGGYPTPPVGIMPPSGPLPAVPGTKGPPLSQIPPINQLSSMAPIQAPTPGVFNAPQPTQFSQLPVAAPPVPIKKEIVFPPDAVESTQPVITRRRKLQRSDVSPVEAWRIMMCLKSGLLAETTWALDVLNVLLYDDFTVTYFSLNYLPGLLDLILEHLRRSLVLIFGQSVGIEGADVKEDNSTETKTEKKWYELAKKTSELEADLGTPLEKFDRSMQSRTVVLNGANYTLKTRNSKPIKFVSRDEDLFVIPGPRDWDVDEKGRLSGDVDTSPNTIMDITRHVVTSFTSDLNIVPIIRFMGHEKGRASEKESESRTMKVKVKVEPMEYDVLEDGTSHEAVNLDIYQSYEMKKATESLLRVSPKKVPHPLPNGLEDSSSNSSTSRTLPTTNCVVKAKKDKTRLQPTSVEVEVEENTLIEPPPPRLGKNGKGAEFLSDNAVMMNGLENESSNQSLTSTTENSSSDFCDSNNTNTTTSKQCTPQQTDQQLPHYGQTQQTSLNASPNYITVRDGCGKRKRMDEWEDECFTRDEASLGVVTETQDGLGRRCLSILNILRSLTFVPGNDIELGRSHTFLSLIGKLILLHHDHPLKTNSKSPATKRKRMKCEDEKIKEEELEGGGQTLLMGVGEEETLDALEDETDENIMAIATAAAAAAASIDSESCTSLNVENHWWWEILHHIREHVLVMMANISGQVDLSQFSEEISRPIFDGLLHWAVCPAAYGQDPFPTVSQHSSSSLSPRRLAIEALCKLSVTQGNVDLLLATPPFSRIERLCQLLSRGLCRTEDQVVREFSINLLSYLSGADSGVARTIALQNPCISLLIAFIEQAESNARNIVETHGFSVLRENPESMGTSLDMLRRAATTLHNLAKHPDNRPLFVQHESRLLQLVMSQILEQKVAAIVAQVLFTFSMAEGSGHGKYGASDLSDIFYTPSLSRSRLPVGPVHHPQQQHVIPPPGPNYTPY